MGLNTKEVSPEEFTQEDARLLNTHNNTSRKRSRKQSLFEPAQCEKVRMPLVTVPVRARTVREGTPPHATFLFLTFLFCICAILYFLFYVSLYFYMLGAYIS